MQVVIFLSQLQNKNFTRNQNYFRNNSVSYKIWKKHTLVWRNSLSCRLSRNSTLKKFPKIGLSKELEMKEEHKLNISFREGKNCLREHFLKFSPVHKKKQTTRYLNHHTYKCAKRRKRSRSC